MILTLVRSPSIIAYPPRYRLKSHLLTQAIQRTNLSMPVAIDTPVLANRASLQQLITRALDERWTVSKLAEESGVSRATAALAMSERVEQITQNEERKSLKVTGRVWNAISDAATRRVRFIEILNKKDADKLTFEDIKLENAAVTGLKGFLDMLEKHRGKVETDDDHERLVGGSLNRK